MELKTVLIGALALAATLTVAFLNKGEVRETGVNQKFTEFSQKFGRKYASPQEVEYRLSVFADNLAFAEETNNRQSSFTAGVNQFSDLTWEEFKRFYLLEPVANDNSDRTEWRFDGAETKDWNAEGKVTPVKNQGMCGSCWAFSTTGSLESALAIKTNKLNQYSEQELVDCSRSYGNYGCSGGLMTYAFKYIHDKKIGTEDEYPYKGVDQACHSKQSDNRVTVSGFRLLAKNDVPTLVSEIRKQPVSVAIEVQRDFQAYKGGVYKNNNCGSALNHGVLAAGFVTGSKDGDYFIVKNSWSGSWGEKGYIRMAFGTGQGTCGIANAWDAIPVL